MTHYRQVAHVRHGMYQRDSAMHMTALAALRRAYAATRSRSEKNALMMAWQVLYDGLVESTCNLLSMQDKGGLP